MVGRTVVADAGVPPALTIAYAGFSDAVAGVEEADTVSVKAWVTLTSTVFAGFDSLTTAVDRIVWVVAGNVTAGTVTVSV